MLPAPAAAIPILVLLFVHAKVPPAGVEVKASAATAAPLHTVCAPGAELTVGIGLIVILNVPAVPAQPFKVGETEIVPTC